MNWTVRDSVPYLAVVFYATPPVVIGTLAVLLAWIRRKRSGLPAARISTAMNRATALLGLICLLQWAVGSFRYNPSSVPQPDALKVVFWNIGWGRFASRERIAEQARGFDADVLAFAETSARGAAAREFWEMHMPGYSAHPLKAGMVLLVKGQAVERTAGPLGDGGNYRHLSIEVRGVRFDILLADLASNPIRSRERPLKSLFDMMQRQAAIPTLVMGDFNTPPTSVWFDGWRTDWTRAWEAAGSGYQATWPQPLPVLALDHAWGNRQITFQRCSGAWSSSSDHRPVIVELTVKENSASISN